MPYVIRPKRFKASLAALVAGTLLALIALPAAAHAACPSTTTTLPFKQFGDSASYGLVPNGGFETGTSGWALTNAAAASGNESYKVRSASDSKSLLVQPTGIAWIELVAPKVKLKEWLGGEKLPLRVEEHGSPGLRAVGIATAEGEVVLR